MGTEVSGMQTPVARPGRLRDDTRLALGPADGPGVCPAPWAGRACLLSVNRDGSLRWPETIHLSLLMATPGSQLQEKKSHLNVEETSQAV